MNEKMASNINGEEHNSDSLKDQEIEQLKRENAELRAEIQKKNEKIESLLVDDLTGAYRNVWRDEEFRNEQDSIISAGGPYTVLRSDINGLREHNHKHGHNAADKMIFNSFLLQREIIENIKNQTNSQVTYFRVGGDEFAYIFPGLSKDAVNGLFIAEFRRKNDIAKLQKIDTLDFTFGLSDISDLNDNLPKTLAILSEIADGREREAKQKLYTDTDQASN